MTRNDGRSRDGASSKCRTKAMQNAIDTLNGSDVDNRTIRVEFQNRGAVSSAPPDADAPATRTLRMPLQQLALCGNVRK